MIPAVWSSFFMDLSPQQAIGELARAGWPAAELSDEHAAELLGRGEAAAMGSAFARHAADQGLAVPQGHLWLAADITDDASDILDRLKRWLDLFVAAGIRGGVLHPGGAAVAGRGGSEQDIHAARVEALGGLCDHVGGTELVICLENIPRSAPDVRDLLALIDAVGSEHLGICLDTGHLNLHDGDQARFVREAGGHLKATHLADNDGSGDQHVMPFGLGTVRWAELFSALRATGYAGLCNFEIPGERRCPLAVRRAKLAYLREIADWLTHGGADGADG